jgi:aconitase A
VLGVVDGKEIRLKDLWPSDEEIDAIVQSQRQAEQFRKVYEPMFALRADVGTSKVSPLYDWRPHVHLHPPPALLGRRAGRTAHADRHAPAGVLPDNITTDHLSPSNAIMMNSAAGEYLQDGPAGRGLQLLRHPPRRPPDRHARDVRQPDAEKRNGARYRRQGKTRLAGACRAGRQSDAHVGSNRNLYGPQTTADHRRRRGLRPGVSRDWAAKGVRLAGVEAIAAEGFERIHRTNLIGMGVLPLEFKPGTTRLTLGLDGTETYDVVGHPQATRRPHTRDPSQERRSG